jgi:hypothetical protein
MPRGKTKAHVDYLIMSDDACKEVSALSEEAMYSLKLDTVSDSVVYVGEAAPGSPDSSPVWRIKKITSANDDVAIEWADGVATFIKKWTDRATYNYT